MAFQFKHLFTPLKVGTMTVPNRIVSTAHISRLAELDGLPGPRQIAYWEAKAKGGVGLIGTQAYSVHQSHGDAPVVFHNEAFVPRFRQAVDVLHRHGAKVTLQLWHAGRQGHANANGRPIWAPSQTMVRPDYETPHIVNEEEIWELIGAYAAAAARSRDAGLDGVEIHFAHGYLVQQFLSPLTNHRDDRWGGSWENRARFGLETIKAVREAVGRDYTVGIRISGDEFTDGGYTIDDMKAVAPI
ncbi:MAG: NADH:flavin oxidoreductase, partial [Dehalococcoidia bacterium]|nr:NADH:flavin oxidoreductase [Dehalococcoidia bacterium]